MSQRTPVSREVMVLGGTPDAGWVVQELLSLAYQVYWIVPQGEPPIKLQDALLTLYEGAVLTGFTGHVGSFRATLRRNAQPLSLSASALVVATGNERYYPDTLYGIPLSPRVLTLSQLKQQLAIPRSVSAMALRRNERLLFLLDLGQETGKEMASEALRLASRWREQWHGEVYVFYRNLKVDTYGLERLTREMRDKGVLFCRYGNIQVTTGDDGVALTYIEGTVLGERLVLPEAVRPPADTAALARLLQVRVGEDGYFQDVNIHQYRPGLSNRRGIFFAGRCHLDGDEDDIRADAVQAAANVDALLRRGFLEPDAVRALVDSSKCIRCLTCVRTCPHAAVEIAEYDDVTAARVVELACQGCGACVCNCPVRAIELVGQALPAWAMDR